MFHWLLVAPQALKSVLPVVDSFSDKEMRILNHIRAHQSTSETFNTSLWRRKTKPASVNYFWYISVGSFCLSCVVECCKNDFSSQSQKEPVSYFNQYSRIFSGTLASQKAQRPISLPPVIASAISSFVFFDHTSCRSSATALLVKLGLFSLLRRSKSVTCSSIFCPQQVMLWTSQYSELAH